MMKRFDFLRRLALKQRRRIGWQGQGGEPSPALIGAIVALLFAGIYTAVILFGHKG